MKTEQSKPIKLILLISIVIIIVGGIVILTKGFNVGLDYSEAKNIKIYFEASYNDNDLNQILNDVFENENRKIQEIEYFHDAVSIKIKNVSDEQIDNLKQKIGEKYNIDDIDKHIIVNDIPGLKLKDLAKPYIMPIIIATIIIFIYIVIRFRKIGIKETVLIPVVELFVIQLTYISLIAICRIPFGKLVIPVSILLYILSIVCTIIKLSNKEEQINLKENSKNK